MNEKMEIQLMDLLDGKSMETSNSNMVKEAEELQDITIELQHYSHLQISESVDRRIDSLIALEATNRIKAMGQSIKRFWPAITASVALVLGMFIFNSPNNLNAQYARLETNPTKLNFVFNLAAEVPSQQHINWLQQQLALEQNPNIKVAIIDILAQASESLDPAIFKSLSEESIPAVQMAMLNLASPFKNKVVDQEIRKFSTRSDLQPSVRHRVNELLSSIK